MTTKAVKEEKKKEDDWMTKKWRPMMAMMYMFCCLADFFIFPIMFTVVQFWETQAANDAFRQWVPITLQGGGLFHVAMGAVLGVSAYGRTQEKLNGATGTPLPGAPNAQPGIPAPSLGGSTFGVPSPNLSQPGGPYNSPGANSWGQTPIMGNTGGYQPGYGATPPMGNSFGAPGQVTTGFGGKLAPPQPDFYPER